MADKNVKAEHVQYVNELLKHANETLILGKFMGHESERMKRWRMKRTVEEETRPAYYDVEFNGPWTLAGMREWLDVIEAVSKELGIEATLETDYDSSLNACWQNQILYTEEDREEARAWLEANPEPEPKPIQFRTVKEKIQWSLDEDDFVEPF